MANSIKETIYLTIPTEYVIVYKKLLECLLDSGIEIIKNCNCNCKNNRVRIIFDCWCAFQSAIAAKKLGRTKEADLIIKYVSAQIDLLCECTICDNDGNGDGGSEDNQNCTCKIVEVDFETGILKVESECETCNIPEFYIDPNTGNLYSFYDGTEVPQDVRLKDGNLIQAL